MQLGLTCLVATLLAPTASALAGSDATRTSPKDPASPTGERRIALTDLPWVTAQGGLGPVQADGSVGGPAPSDGGALTVEGRVFARGIGTAATSLVTYDLRGEALRFSG